MTCEEKLHICPFGRKEVSKKGEEVEETKGEGLVVSNLRAWDLRKTQASEGPSWDFRNIASLIRLWERETHFLGEASSPNNTEQEPKSL